jgi:hypothetical protein
MLKLLLVMVDRRWLRCMTKLSPKRGSVDDKIRRWKEGVKPSRHRGSNCRRDSARRIALRTKQRRCSPARRLSREEKGKRREERWEIMIPERQSTGYIHASQSVLRRVCNLRFWGVCEHVGAGDNRERAEACAAQRVLSSQETS